MRRQSSAPRSRRTFRARDLQLGIELDERLEREATLVEPGVRHAQARARRRPRRRRRAGRGRSSRGPQRSRREPGRARARRGAARRAAPAATSVVVDARPRRSGSAAGRRPRRVGLAQLRERDDLDTVLGREQVDGAKQRHLARAEIRARARRMRASAQPRVRSTIDGRVVDGRVEHDVRLAYPHPHAFDGRGSARRSRRRPRRRAPRAAGAPVRRTPRGRAPRGPVVDRVLDPIARRAASSTSTQRSTRKRCPRRRSSSR